MSSDNCTVVSHRRSGVYVAARYSVFRYNKKYETGAIKFPVTHGVKCPVRHCVNRDAYDDNVIELSYHLLRAFV